MLDRLCKNRVTGWAAALVMLAGCAASLSAQAAELEVSDARMRVLPGDVPAAGYFHLENQGRQPVVLVGAQSEAFGSVELHRSMSQDGMSSMESVDRLEVASDDVLEFAPQGYHLMLMQPTQSLSVGDRAEITLTFETRESLTVDFEAVPPTSM